MPRYKYRFIEDHSAVVEYTLTFAEKEQFEKDRPWLERVIEPVAFGDLSALRKAHD